MRFSNAAANSASQEMFLRYRLLVDVGITSGTAYVCTGNDFLYALANTYSPNRGLGGIEAIEEEADGSPRAVRAWLPAVGSADLYEALREDMFNRPFVVRHGFLTNTSDQNTFVSTPEVLWRGKINKVEARFADAERGNFFEIEAETALRRRPPASNFNIETHWTTMGYSGDTFFNYIDQVPLYKALWGQQPVYFTGGNGVYPTPQVPDFGPGFGGGGWGFGG